MLLNSLILPIFLLAGDPDCQRAKYHRIDSGSYRTTIDVYGRHISGILIFKTVDTTKRAVFINEMGLKFFDLEFSTSGFQVKYCMSALNKKAVLNLLRNDLSLLLMPSSNDAKTIKNKGRFVVWKFAGRFNKFDSYYVTPTCESIAKIRSKGVVIALKKKGANNFHHILIRHRIPIVKIELTILQANANE